MGGHMNPGGGPSESLVEDVSEDTGTNAAHDTGRNAAEALR